MSDSENGQPLVLQGGYAPCIDAAGSHPITGYSGRRNPMCDYLLTAFKNDVVEIDCEGEHARLSKRGLFLIPPGRSFSVDMQGGGWLHWVHFSVKDLPGWRAFEHHIDFGLHRPGRNQFMQPVPYEVWGLPMTPWAPTRLTAELLVLVDEMVGAWLDGDTDSKVEANLILAQLLSRWVRQIRKEQSQVTDPDVAQRLRRAERFARRRTAVDVSVADMAQAAGYTRSHFTAVYQRHRGQSPGTFLRQLRLSEAATLLRTQDLAVRVVGELVGYPNPSAFARSFKQHYGCSPEAFRNQAPGPDPG